MSPAAFTASDGARIAYGWDGPTDAPVLVLSNSLGTAMDMWRDQIAAFGQAFRVLRYDSRGHGRSSSPPGEYSIARLGLDVVELLNHLGLRQVHYCGLSMGGMVGQWLGAHAGDRIGRLVLCNTSAHTGAETWRMRMELVRSGGMALVADRVVERWFTPGFLAAQPAAVWRAQQMILSTDPIGYAGCCAAIRDMDLRPSAGTIAAPCLVIGGTGDQATPASHSEWLAGAIPSATLRLLPAAHLSNIECADDFTRLVQSFLTPARQTN